MLDSEKIAIAAHLHVLLRRKTGRVTDTEWMAKNAEYADDVVHYARAQAEALACVELQEWADKLAKTFARQEMRAAMKTPELRPIVPNPAEVPAPANAPSHAVPAAEPVEEAPPPLRYIGGLR